MPNKTFHALANEAAFTKEMLGSGATQIRNAHYASKGVYFQSFTGLATGLERIGKLCLMLDHYIDHDGKFPDANYMKEEICHKIVAIYDKSKAVIARRSTRMTFLQNLDDPIRYAILSVLSEFAQGDRYCNINLLAGRERQNDPSASWYRRVDLPLWKACVKQKRKDTIRRNAVVVAELLGPYTMVRHTTETGDDIDDLEDASFRTGVYEAVAPYRQLYVLQIIRFWVELLYSLQDLAMERGGEDIPHFGDMFALFYNTDSYFRTRRTWDRI